ncbi:hypothetical protein [Flavobacterium algicola]|uniref:hypothetical protein n=1 Tax=Flavobacterium algicola TaxID=556529 RepID=UPI001EFDECB6|nr:hypothetical protein [Flavobacterium algicola]MCG9793927.1 hypothetical protein [Flavobacterium algicola]
MFTFCVLVTLGLISFGHILSFMALIGIVIYIDRTKLKMYSNVFINEKLWIEFTFFLFVIVFLMNVYLIKTKGFLLFQDNVGAAKQDFYQGAGIFKRINQVALPLISLSSFYYWYDNKKIKSTLYILFSMFLLLTLGSKAALIELLFIFGVYSRFKKISINYAKLMPIMIVLFFSSLFAFFLIFGDTFLADFAYRIIAFSDGPVYYYYGELSQYINYPILYMFDQFFVGLRIFSDLHFSSLGPLINSLYFNYEDALVGPNPQIFVEADVLAKNFYFFYYIIIGFIFIFLRKCMATPFSFLLMNLFITPLFVDVQFAFSNLFSLIILLFIFIFYFLVKKIFLFGYEN